MSVNEGMLRSSLRNEGINKTDAVLSSFACGLFFFILSGISFKRQDRRWLSCEFSSLIEIKRKKNCCYLFFRSFMLQRLC